MENPDLLPYAVSIIRLLQGPVYSEDKCWEELLLYRREITAHWRQLGIELIVEEKDGYAFLHQVEDDNKNTIGLIKRIAMTYEQTLMCVLLREWLDEFEVKDTDNRNLYVTHRQCRERIEMFFKGSPNEVKLVKNLDSLIKDMLGFGFLKKFGEPENQEDARYEVRRIIKSRITADKLLEFKQILVPAKYYAQVNRYVNEHNLRGRIIYQQIVEKEQLNAFLPEVKDNVFSKVNINPHSEYGAWVENQLRTRYDYICTADLDLFQGYKRAITPAGLIKNERRHEKDDRPEVFRRENFVLGWDNKEKIQWVKSKLKETDREIKEKENLYKQAERQQKRLADEQTGLIRFKEFNAFEEIDWQTCAVQIQQKEVQKAALEQTNERVKVLQGQLKEVTERKKKVEAEHTLLVDRNLRLKSALDANRSWQKENEVLLSTCADMDLTEQLEDFGGYFSSYHIRLDYPNFKEIREKVRQQLNREIQHKSEKFQEERHQLEKLQINFKTPSEELRNRFPDWESDVHKLSDNWQYAEDYIGMYTRIKEEELVTYKEKFRKFLNKNMIERMTDFQTVMDNQDTNIRDNIEVLNAALEKINYRDYPETYIELGIREEVAEKIRRFKLDLKGWKPNIGEYEVTKNDKILEDSFLKIKSLVDSLSENENDRRYVTDVRNWLTFIAKEVRRSDKGVFRTYESTGRLSAGERAQLTYTILASAIAYQFGISQTGNNTDSFRFICIDESFSNQDARKSGYLMELCRQLHLQLLCVTPEDKTYVVEDYISAVHFVKRKNNRNAVIYDMPIRQFKEERDKFQQTSAT